MAGERVPYSPPWAPHVAGWHEPPTVDPDTGLPDSVHVGATCTVCGEKFQRTCASGLLRQWVARFASLHAHRDVLATPVPRPGGGQ